MSSSDWANLRYERGAASKTILIVEDDDEFVADLASFSKGIEGPSVDWQRASTVQEGLSHLDDAGSLIPDIAIVDIGLPDENGLEFVKQVRERNLAFPIIVISQNDLGQVRFEGQAMSLYQLKNLGTTDFQSKTAISDSTEGFIRFVISVSNDFERMLSLADRPDRVFHSALSTDAIRDLQQAIHLCRNDGFLPSLGRKAALDDTRAEMIVHYLESVVTKEKLRLQYTLRLSSREKMAAFVTSRHEETLELVSDQRSPLARLADALLRIWSPLPRPKPHDTGRT